MFRGRKANPLCFRTKAKMLRAFVDVNRHVMEPCEHDTTGASFDPINHKYDRNGRKKVTSCEEAVRVASPTAAPYCLDMIDVKSLNELDAAKTNGKFRLPSAAQDAINEREWREHYSRFGGAKRRKRRAKRR